MNKIFTKGLIFGLFFTLLLGKSAFAQSITVGNVDPGPYAPGSTIAVPISVSGGCVTTNTTYKLYLSNAAGSFAAPVLIGTFTNFYATFVNGIIPAGTAPGTNYKVEVVSSNPAITSTVSAPFSIVAGTGVVAGVSSQLVSPTYPLVFGTCSGSNNTPYSFVNTSTSGATVTAVFFDETTQTSAGSITPNSTGANFTASAANYTITVKATNGGVVGTEDYILMNNGVNTSFGVTGNNVVCLNGGGSLSYNVDISSPSGIQNNFPGLIYNIKWGDGSTSTLTLCQIIASGGKITHSYTQSSCGNSPNGQNNSFEVDLQPTNQYCGKVGTQVTSYAQVITAPQNSFNAAATACTNTPVVFENTSYAGQNPNSTSSTCEATNALYQWSVDGVVQVSNYSLGQSFIYTFTTNGTHNISLHLQNPSAACSSSDFSQSICIQNPPQPKFTLPATEICMPAAVTPTDLSIIDANCNINNTYQWTVTGPAAVTYAGGTNTNSKQPQFVFNTAGSYQVSLGINTASCGLVTSSPQTIVVDAPTVVNLSPDASICGTNQALTFGPGAGPTQSTITGVGQAGASTYTWTVTGGAYSFTGGTNANTQYPQIMFTVFATYTITVTVTDKCGVTTKTQKLTFEDAPTATATATPSSICPGSPTTLKGTITGTYTSFQWMGAGTFSAPGALTTTYTPTAAEIAAGTATVILDVKTNLSGPCGDIQQSVTITIFPINNITSALTALVCTGNAVNYTVTSSVPASTFTWTAALTSGTATGFKNGSGAIITDVLKNTGTTNATVTYTITPAANGCTGNPATLTVTVLPQASATAVPATATICSGSADAITLTPNIAGVTYTWTSTATGSITGNSQQSAPINTTSINNVLTNNGATAGIVTYIVTPYNGSCPGTPVTVNITVEPVAVVSNAGNNDEICNAATYQLNGNSAGAGTGVWTVSPSPGISFNNPASPNAIASGLVAGKTYTFTWTITPPAPCTSNASSVTVIDDIPSVGGTTTGTGTVCSGGNSGTITLAGQTGAITGWQSSIDNGTTWQAILPVNNTHSQSYQNLTQTTQYRAMVQNGKCSLQFSTVAIVTVNPPPIQAIAGGGQNLCGATTATLQGNNPAPFTGMWTQTSGPTATIVSPNNPQTQITGLTPGNTFTFTWTISGLAPCPDNSDVTTISDAADVMGSFTPDKTSGCGDLTVNFNNTSTPLTGATFLWDFGDGSPQSNAVSPTHVFAAHTDGTDVTYTVTMFVVNNCVQRPPVTVQIKVTAQTPVASILPQVLTGCAPFTLDVRNTSPGNSNVSYTFYLYNGANQVAPPIVKTDKSDATFTIPNTTNAEQLSVYMVAMGPCGNSGQSAVIPISVSPSNVVAQMFPGGPTNGCVPFTATFVNNSIGGTSYVYNIYDANNNLVASPTATATPLNYIFNTPGTYKVTISVSNTCTNNLQSSPVVFTVYPLPQPGFTADNTSGCISLTVKFTNQTTTDPSIQPQSLNYEWDFGDGQQSNTFSPTHTYTASNTPYTVTLTATNPITGCSNVLSQTSYINVSAPPVTAFTENPEGTTEIPNYHFDFTDLTTGNPVIWLWNFGDGTTSTQQNPGHTYADTGKYVVTLTTVNAEGCNNTTTQKVRVTGVPGQLFLPNAFEPNSGTIELQTFMAKGSGIKEWHMQVFNNYSQLIWETTKLNEKGQPIDGWDGTFNGMPMPQGVYIWQVSATFINGTEWKGNVIKGSLPKRVGVIHLIR